MASNRTNRIKVSVPLLLEAVKAERARLVAEFEAAKQAFPAAEIEYRLTVVEALRKMATDIDHGGKLPDTGWHGVISIACSAKKPEEPELNTDQIDRFIQTLEMAADSSISMSADDATRYLR